MINNVSLTGRLTAKPELRTTASGISVTSVTVAVDRPKKKDEEKVTDFINCVAWRETAEILTKYFDKGSLLGIEGSLQTRKFMDKEGNNRTATEVLIRNLSFLESKKDSAPAPSYMPDSYAASAGSSSGSSVIPGIGQSAPAPASSVSLEELTDDDDLPF